MTYKSAWEGDWPTRIKGRVKEKGYDSLIMFAEKHPKATFAELAGILGEQIAPIQIEQMLSEDYYDRGEYPRHLRSALVRHFRHKIPLGWNVAENFDYEFASGFVNWETNTSDEYSEFKEKLLKVLKSLNLPQGWLPISADDPIIVDAFEKAGFRELELAEA